MATATSGPWAPSDNRLGVQNIQSTSTTQNNTLGTIIRAVDTSGSFGEGEFIYLLGVASTVAGIMVRWDATTFQTTILPSTANLDVPIAVAMSANVASQYGWYQISGMCSTLKTAVQVTPQNKVYISGTAGRVFVTSTSGKELMGARTANLTTVTSTTSAITLQLSRPFAQGQIT
jgi:hypothetical protein